MKNVLRFMFWLAIISLLFSGCGKLNTIQGLDDTHYFEKSVPQSRVAKAIRMGASRKGWRTRKVKNGLIIANITVRGKYFVSVYISYDSKGYKISYKDSRNLKYNPANNSIHPSYNKWTRILEKNINYELSNVYATDEPQKFTSTEHKKKIYKKRSKINLNGKTIYIKPFVPFARHSRVKHNIKTECTLPKALADSIVKYAAADGIDVVMKNRIKPNQIELKVQIDEAVSSGNAFVGHNKFVVISGGLVKGHAKYYTFDAGRLSGGGYFGAYRSSCSVLGRIARALGKDVANWLAHPYDVAMLGDTELIRK